MSLRGDVDDGVSESVVRRVSWCDVCV